MIGLERGKVKLVPHSGGWKKEASSIISRLWRIFGGKAVAIEHIGSTAIRGIAAKPIIDIMAAFGDIDDVKRFVPELEKDGFYFRPDAGADGQYLLGSGSYYEKTGNEQTCFVHVVKAGGMAHLNYVNFRDYMNAFPYMAEKYEKLKKKLASEHPLDRKAYTEGKNEFMTYALRKAMVWSYLGKKITIKTDRPLGYVHEKEKYTLVYPVNYGYIPDVLGGDGEELDVYLLGVDTPVDEYECRVIGIAHRKNDVEDKLVACPDGMVFDQAQIAEKIDFQEKYYQTSVEAVHQLSCGAVVYRDTANGREYLLLHQKRSGRWSFPKGHKEAYETDGQAAVREIFEETALKTEVDTAFSAEIRYRVTPKTKKTVRLFTAEANGEVHVCGKEITDFLWADSKKVLSLLPPDSIGAFVKLSAYIAEKAEKQP